MLHIGYLSVHINLKDFFNLLFCKFITFERCNEFLEDENSLAIIFKIFHTLKNVIRYSFAS